MSNIAYLLSSFLLTDLNAILKPKKLVCTRLLVNLGGFIAILVGYVLGCRVLYNYLVPDLGEVLSLAAVCVLLLITSLLLFIIGWFLKPKEPPIKEFIAKIEKSLSEVPNNETVKKIVSQITPKTVIAFFAIAAVTSYLAGSHKKT